MKCKILVCFILVLVSFLSGCTTTSDYHLYVVQHVTPLTRAEISSDHTQYVTYNERQISGYSSRWKGDINNTAAIEEDYSTYRVWTCDVDKDQTCDEIKPGDILLVKVSIWHGYEREIVGSILT